MKRTEDMLQKSKEERKKSSRWREGVQLFIEKFGSSALLQMRHGLRGSLAIILQL